MMYFILYILNLMAKKTLLMTTYDTEKLKTNIDHYKQWCDPQTVVSVTEYTSKLVNGLYEIYEKSWVA